MSNKYATYSLVRFDDIDPETNESQTLEGVIGGFFRVESGGYVYEVYVPAEDSDFEVEETELTAIGSVSPAEYRLIIEQKNLSVEPPSDEEPDDAEDPFYRTSGGADQQKLSLDSNRYGALRGLASLASVLAFLSPIGAVIGVVAGLLATGNSFVGGLGWLIVLFSVFAGAISYFIFQVAAESILVLLDMENNTRETANYLQQAVALLEERLK